MLTFPRWALAVLGVLGTLIVLGSSTCRGKAESPSTLLPCDDPEHMLSQSVLARSRIIDVEEVLRYREKNPLEQAGSLSVRLELTQKALKYTDPIDLHLIITNETGSPVVFQRPGTIALSPAWFADLIVLLQPSPAEVRNIRVKQSLPLPPSRELFSVLGPGQSCTVNLHLIWNRTLDHLSSPLSPGYYEMRVYLQAMWVGPRTSSNVRKLYDVGAWVGRTWPSNVVAFTIQPPDGQ